MKLSLTLLACIFFSFCSGQQQAADMSAPLDLREDGVNKVLCMKNGNTLLFHFEQNKMAIVKVFDSTHKEIASQKHPFRLFDLTMMAETEFKGLYPINGEGVLFIDQPNLGKHRLLRLRIDGSTGGLIDEAVVGESPGIGKRTDFYVLKNKNEENYEVFFFTDVPQFENCEAQIKYYSANHEQTKTIVLEVDRKKYDNAFVVSAESDEHGVCISLCLRKMIANATNSGGSPINAVYGYDLAIMFVPKGSDKPISRTVNLSEGIYPYYSNYSYNPFVNAINILLYSYKALVLQNGIGYTRASVNGHLFLRLNEQSRELGFTWIKYEKANAHLKNLDTNFYFEGMPLHFFTNENGLTTLISETHLRYDDRGTFVRNRFATHLGNIAITQFDDDGGEIWGTVLPKSQILSSQRQFYYPDIFRQKHTSYTMFGDLPEPVYSRQFASVNAYSIRKNFYIIYNDHNGNFNNSIAKPGDTVYNFNLTDACYYKMDRTKTLTKHYLLGEPAPNEYRSSFIEGADFDEQRGMYATLVRYKKNNDVSLRMAWARLD